MPNDARQIILLAALLSWVLAVFVEFQASKARRKGLWPDCWTLALLSVGLGLGLFSQRGVLGVLWTVWLANVLMMLSFSLFYLAIERARGDSPSVLIAALPPLAIAILFPIMGLSEAVVLERIAVYTIVSFAACSIVAAAALLASEPGRRRGPWTIFAAMMAAMVIHAVRALRAIEQVRIDLFAAGTPQILFYVAVLAGVAVATWGYMDMISSARTERHDDTPATA